VRFPTCVEDVARVISDLISKSLPPPKVLTTFASLNNKTRLDLSKTVPPIVHYSSQTGLTKYQQLSLIAPLLDLPISHVKPDSVDPATKPNPSGVVRPGNTQLSVEGLKKLGVDVRETESGGFEEWWKRWAEERRLSKA